MAFVLSCQLVSGTGLFCTGQFLHASRSLGNDPTALAVAAADREGVSGTALNSTDIQSETPPCTCKKHKKCPTIPRAAITSNANYRANEYQRQAESACYGSFVPQAVDVRFGAGGDRSPTERPCLASLYTSTVLASTCVLLI
jgi:hypothetical protein